MTRVLAVTTSENLPPPPLKLREIFAWLVVVWVPYHQPTKLPASTHPLNCEQNEKNQVANKMIHLNVLVNISRPPGWPRGLRERLCVGGAAGTRQTEEPVSGDLHHTGRRTPPASRLPGGLPPHPGWMNVPQPAISIVLPHKKIQTAPQTAQMKSEIQFNLLVRARPKVQSWLSTPVFLSYEIEKGRDVSWILIFYVQNIKTWNTGAPHC